MRQLRYLQAMNEAYQQVMDEDKSVLIIGEDIRGALRGETKGLHSAFGDQRVIDTPISEAGFTGFATGAALAGLRPIVQFQVPSLIYVAFDQLVNQSAKMRLMLGGQADLPITYTIMVSGTRGSNAGQHSDNPYPYLVHAGFKVVCPSTAYDAKGLMVQSIRENDPVVFIASAMSLPQKGQVPEELYTVPFGQGDVKRPGTDVTVVAVGHLVPEAIAVAESLAKDRGIDVEVWDPRTLLPFDREGLLKSVRKTGRVVIYDDTNRTCGYAAEVSAVLAEHAFGVLRAPVKRITRADVPLPFNPALEAAVLPTPQQLEQAIVSVWSYSHD
ncbi:transketolase C-terminal domain-containing protein [Mesorhizobium sp. VK4C]|uniref:alpha-ketoacid dehydrogenase subunit beta n=1 Tax=Mesorhizobium captivum TaxID=3072319 RepID=UPI002A23A7E1|nr:transketolase C-terminal domain-containing protein [Mesorhizobium sp. VK4C]MDX8503614.1 transketolase C-terminal domain-containing protein [Mesorhizobium sp. VK4C]